MSYAPTKSMQARMLQSVPTVTWQDIDWADATPVRPKDGAFRYVIPVNLAGGGELFDLEAAEKSGKKVGGWTLKKGVGMTFVNPVDDSLQGVPGDGTGVLIVNGTDPQKAAVIRDIISNMGGMRSITSVLSYRALINRIGKEAGRPDIYNSDHAWLDKNTVQDPSLLDSALTFMDGDHMFGFLPKTSEASLAYYLTVRTNFVGSRGQTHGLVGPVGIIVKNPSMIKVNDAGEPDPNGTREVPDIYASQVGPFVSDYVLMNGVKILDPSKQLVGISVTIPATEDVAE